MHRHFNIQSGHPIYWFWPVYVSVSAESDPDAVIRRMTEYHWAAELSTVEPLAKQVGKRYNICYFDSGISGLPIANQDHFIKCDILIVKESSRWISDNGNSPDVRDVLEQAIHQFEASGVLVIAYQDPIEEWYNNFIMELSHNVDVVQALEITTQDGVFLYDPRLIEDTRLSNFVERLIISLDLYERQDPILIDSKLTDGQIQISPQDLSYELFQRSPSFLYEHESGEGEGVAQMSRSIFSQLPSSILEKGWAVQNQHHETTVDDVGAEDGPTRSKKKADEDKRQLIPRFLQGAISLQPNQVPDVPLEYLKAETIHYFLVRIGPYEKGWTQSVVPMTLDEVFRESQDPQPIEIFLRHNLDDEIQHQTIILPFEGASTMVPFQLPAAPTSMLFEGELLCYHRNRLIQQVKVLAWILKDITQTQNLPPIQMQVVSGPRIVLNDLQARAPFGASFLLQGNEEDQRVIGASGDKLTDLRYEEGLRKIVKGIRLDLEEAVKHVDDHPEDLSHPNNVSLLVRLALKGRKIYDNFLKREDLSDGPIQIVTNISEYVPLDFVYSFPAPALDATLCAKAIGSLDLGRCQDCYKEWNTEAPHICPFGFWTFSRVIERHAVVKDDKKLAPGFDFSLVNEPLADRSSLPILQKSLFAATSKVEGASPGLIKKIFETLTKVSERAEKVLTWDEWILQIDQLDPDSLILMVHSEHNADADDEQIEIGKDQFKIQTYINDRYIADPQSEVRPILFLIGCNTKDTEASGFDVTSQFINQGAPLVLSNFTKIRGRQAGPIVMEMLEALNGQKGETSFGEVLLKVRQRLLAKGIMVSLALIAHGDADWKLKIA